MEGRREAPYLPALVVLLSIALMVFLLLLLPRHIPRAAQIENGPIENATVVLYVAGAVLAWVFGKRKIWRKGYTGGAMLLLFALRELDFHTRFTAKSLSQWDFLISSRAAPSEKVIGLAVYFIVAVLLARLLVDSRLLLNAVRSRRPYAISTLSGIFLIPVSKLLDSTAKFLRKKGMEVNDDVFLTWQLLEEAFELAIPLLFLIALLQWREEAGGDAGGAPPWS